MRKMSILSILPWAGVAATDVLLKMLVLHYSGFQQTTQAWGRAGESLTRMEQFEFLHGDLLWSCLLVPLILLICLKWVPARLRLIFVGLLSFVAEVVLLTQYSTFRMLGRFVSLDILMTGVNWWMEHPEGGKDGPAARLLTRLAVALVFTVSLALAAAWFARRSEGFLTKWIRRSSFAALGLCALLALLSWPPERRAGLFHSDLLVTSISSYLNDSQNADPAVFKLSAQKQSDLYRETARIPTDTHVPAYFGKADGYNVLLFIFETAPTRILDPAQDELRDMPNLRQLRDRAFVSTRHYTTFPATNRATFSILTSMYMTSAFGTAGRVAVPGMIQILNQQGYHTGYYGYVWERGDDAVMLKDLGFQRQINSELGSVKYDMDNQGTLSWEDRKRRDTGPLRQLKKDIHEWSEKHQRFALTYFPEFGHGPWPSVPGKPNSNMDERGRYLVSYQDAWLGEILDELKKDGVLDKTIIAVTGDHGIRFMSEHPDFQPGKIADITFHVPLLIYAPGILKSTRLIEWPTSHIDIQPTLLDLLGVKDGRDWEQGGPIWEAGLAHRQVFLLANNLLGADGYYDDGRYYMIQSQLGTAYSSADMHFEAANVLPGTSGAAARVRETIRRMNSIETATRLRLQGGVLRKE